MTHDHDIELVRHAKHGDPFSVLGVHADTQGRLWLRAMLPGATHVTVLDAVGGDFNHWDARCHAMRLRRECGVWEIFIPGVAIGARYKYQLRDSHGHVLPHKADPYALQSELRPATASVVARMPAVAPASAA